MSSWGSGSKISNLQQVGDFSFFEPKFDGTGGTGRDGLDGPEKCPLNFFILCGYID